MRSRLTQRPSSRSRSPAARPYRSRSRSRERHGSRANEFRADQFGDGRRDSYRMSSVPISLAMGTTVTDRRSEPQKGDQQGRESRDGAAKDNRAPLSSSRSEVSQGFRPSASNNQSAGGRPSAAQIQLNKRITAARTFEDILSIVRAEHGEFNAVNTATACSRLAKVQRDSADGAAIDDRRVRILFTTVTRVSSTMEPQAVANKSTS
jgi:hypothetical protein